MSRPAILWPRLPRTWSLVLAVTIFSVSVHAHETAQTIPDPGFRPESEYAAAFLDTVGAAKIAVLPTLVRRTTRTAHSFESQQQIITFVNESGISTALTNPRRIDLGPLRRPSQWEIFQYGATSIAEILQGYETGTDYALVIEVLVPHDQAVFGIEVYIMDRQGQSAFSFLLNSHHQMFREADLTAKGSSEEARTAMIKKATSLGLAALTAQISQARECMASSAAPAPKVGAGIFRDFEDELVSGTDAYGISLGFSTFSDDKSPVSIALTDDHPPVPGQADGNTVLKLSLDVQGWAGVVDIFHNDAIDTWTTRDWSDLDGFSFWLYGKNSGTRMFVHVIDNRNPCSRGDDAERYAYEFWDDVAGWRLISVPFNDMARTDVFNGAPDDGLNLSHVHGWGLGTLNTDGARSFYLDDFRLWSGRPVGESSPLAVITHKLFVETRLDQDSSRVVLEADQQKGLAVEKIMNLNCALAQLTKDRGYRYFKTDERAKLSGGRASFRITFYRRPPEGIPIATKLLAEGEDTVKAADVMTAAMDAEEVAKVCQLMESQPHNHSGETK